MLNARWLVLLVAPVMLGGSVATADEAPPAAAAATQAAVIPQYMGVAKCKNCHSSTKKGEQYRVWLESGHSKAFATLAGEKALEFGAKKGIKEPQKAPECLQCHVTGYGEPADHFASTYSDSTGVGCESCHGAGSGYWKQAVMKEIRSGKSAPAKYGLIMPTREVCAKCHNEKSPSGKFVDFPADSAKIAHPIPPGGETPDPK